MTRPMTASDLNEGGSSADADTQPGNSGGSSSFREGRFAILRGVGRYTGDGWKDCTKKGQVVFTYGCQLPRPYGEGQYERVGNICWTASTHQFEFRRAHLWEVLPLIPAIIRDRKDKRLFAFRWSRLPTTANSVGTDERSEGVNP